MSNSPAAWAAEGYARRPSERTRRPYVVRPEPIFRAGF
jgi:hypothetical protein